MTEMSPEAMKHFENIISALALRQQKPFSMGMAIVYLSGFAFGLVVGTVLSFAVLSL